MVFNLPDNEPNRGHAARTHLRSSSKQLVGLSPVITPTRTGNGVVPPKGSASRTWCTCMHADQATSA